MEERETRTRGTYKVFLPGELVNLCIPNADAIELDGWPDWFNDLKRLQNTGHGLFPNTPEKQLEVLEALRGHDRVALLICDREWNRAYGIVSLQSIDLVRKHAEIAINMADPKNSPLPRLAALEAMARITEHGFAVLGLNRIYAGQAYPNLSAWNRSLELIGYRTEGIARNAFTRGHDVSDVVQIACLYADYLALKEVREGTLWGSLAHIKQSMKRQPKVSFAERVATMMHDISSEYFEFLTAEAKAQE